MTSTVQYVEENAQLARIYARMPVDVQLSFTPEQMAALGMATYEPPIQHKVAIHKTYRILGRQYYFAMFAGKDRTGGQEQEAHHLADEFRADWRHLFLMVLLFGAGLVLLLVVALTVWSAIAELTGGQYPTAPAAINEFLLK